LNPDLLLGLLGWHGRHSQHWVCRKGRCRPMTIIHRGITASRHGHGFNANTAPKRTQGKSSYARRIRAKRPCEARWRAGVPRHESKERR
jgi:hypothetical protein